MHFKKRRRAFAHNSRVDFFHAARHHDERRRSADYLVRDGRTVEQFFVAFGNTKQSLYAAFGKAGNAAALHDGEVALLRKQGFCLFKIGHIFILHTFYVAGTTANRRT